MGRWDPGGTRAQSRGTDGGRSLRRTSVPPRLLPLTCRLEANQEQASLGPCSALALTPPRMEPMPSPSAQRPLPSLTPPAQPHRPRIPTHAPRTSLPSPAHQPRTSMRPLQRAPPRPSSPQGGRSLDSSPSQRHHWPMTAKRPCCTGGHGMRGARRAPHPRPGRRARS